MKKIFSIHNVFLMLVLVLIGVLSLNIKEAKAAGTLTWSGPSSITIRETISNIANPITGTSNYNLYIGDEKGEYISSLSSPVSTITYSGNETITNYQINKTATMDLTSISYLPYYTPGDYTVWLNRGGINEGHISYTNKYYSGNFNMPQYKITISIRNVVNANDVPTGDFNASLILEECEWDEEDEGYTNCSKVTPSSGILYVDTNYKASSDFGYIELSKTVKGIGADTTKYFPLTITINNDASTDFNHYFPLDSSDYSYPITGIDSIITYNGNTINNPTTITNGTPTTIYLKHNQTVNIGKVTNGGETFGTIPCGECTTSGGQSNQKNSLNDRRIKKLASVDGKTCYGSYFTIEETPGDYTSAFSLDGGALTSGYYVSATPIWSGQINTVDFVNTKEMSPVTGLIFTILPYMILAGIGVGGTLIFMSLKKKKTNKV